MFEDVPIILLSGMAADERLFALPQKGRNRATTNYRMLSVPWANFIVPLAMEPVSNDSALV